jgi:two-component system chemotaxis response regulator CheB
MATHDIIVIGASAGGMDAIAELLKPLPADLPASLFVVQHLSSLSPGYLPEILQRDTPLRVVSPAESGPIEPGCVYVAPPDRHLLVERDRVRVVRGPKENRHRPAIDPLFRSAAWAYGARVVGIVLTGMLYDGTAGLWAVQTCGGVTVVQDPREAQFSSMVANVLQNLKVDHCLPIKEISALVEKLARTTITNGQIHDVPTKIKLETEFAMLKYPETKTDMNTLGTLSPFTCPTCNGSMWELQDGELLRYRCHTGHAFTAEDVTGEHTDAVEQALYSALRVMEENTALLRRMADRVQDQQSERRMRYENMAKEREEHAWTIRQLLANAK